MADVVGEDCFYERFWADSDYQLRYAYWSAVRDRFPALQRVWGTLAAPRRVLDYGSGNGVLSHWLAANGFGQSVLGVDVSRKGVGDANGNFGCERLQFQELQDFEWAADSFDVVVSSHVLEHVEDPEAVMTRLGPLAEWFVFEVPLEDCWWVNLSAAWRGKSRGDNPLGHINFWTRASFNEAVRRSGFIVVRDDRYASAPFFPTTGRFKSILERTALALLGVETYGRLMATHYIVLARKDPSDRRWRRAR